MSNEQRQADFKPEALPADSEEAKEARQRATELGFLTVNQGGNMKDPEPG